MKKLIFIILIFFLKNNVTADEKMNLGLEVYNNKAQCGACHTLNAAGSDGQIGPNLDALKPLEATTINAVTNGIGVMPSWDNILTKDEIEAVAYYVFISTSK